MKKKKWTDYSTPHKVKPEIENQIPRIDKPTKDPSSPENAWPGPSLINISLTIDGKTHDSKKLRNHQFILTIDASHLTKSKKKGSFHIWKMGERKRHQTITTTIY